MHLAGSLALRGAGGPICALSPHCLCVPVPLQMQPELRQLHGMGTLGEVAPAGAGWRWLLCAPQGGVS